MQELQGYEGGKNNQALRASWRAVLPNNGHTQLLRACLLNREAAVSAWKRFQDISGGARSYFERDFIGLKGLLPFVAWSLERNRIPVSADFMTYARVAILREELRSKIYYEVLTNLDKLLIGQELDYALLKGAAFGRWLYPAPNIRHNHAIDLLIPEADLAQAQKVLSGAGYLRSALHRGQYKHDSGLPIILHREVLRSPCPSGGKDIETGLAMPTLDIDGMTARTLTPTLHLHQVLGNAAFADNNGNLRWIVDAVLLIRNTTVEWSNLEDLARQAGLGAFYAEVLAYTVRHFEVTVPAEVITRLGQQETHPHQYAILFASLLCTLGTHRRVWRALSPSLALRVRFISYSLLPPASYLRWRNGFDTAAQILCWHMQRPSRVMARLFNTQIQGARSG